LGNSEKWPKNSRLKFGGSAAPGATRSGRYFGSTESTASSSELKMKPARVIAAERRSGSDILPRISVRMIEETVIRMLALVSAITDSCTWCCCIVRSSTSPVLRSGKVA
jgi:hypothetical protein